MQVHHTFIRAHRIFTRSVPIRGVTPSSHAVVSLSEMGKLDPGSLDEKPFIGDATMKVYNVSPGRDEVWVRGEIDWDDDLDIRITVFVE